MTPKKPSRSAKPYITWAHRPFSTQMMRHREIKLREIRVATTLVSFKVTDDATGDEKYYEIDVDFTGVNFPNPDFDETGHGELHLSDIAVKLLPQMTFAVRDTSQPATQPVTSYTITGVLATNLSAGELKDLNRALGDLTLSRVGLLLGDINFTFSAVTLSKTTEGQFTIKGALSASGASQPTPPLPDPRAPNEPVSLDTQAYGDLPSTYVFKLLELMEFTVTSSVQTARGKSKLFATAYYTFRPKLHCE